MKYVKSTILMSISPKKKVSNISTTPASLLPVGQVDDGWKCQGGWAKEKFPRRSIPGVGSRERSPTT